jgi:DNA-binding CsgD family transcriptional regulator
MPAAIRRALAVANGAPERAELLPAYIQIMLSAAELDEARNACRELERIGEALDTDMLRAAAAQAQGAIALAEGDARGALGPLRRAVTLWQQLAAPYEVARVRALIGVACRALGDLEAGSLEFDAARAMFESLGALPDLARLNSVAKGAASAGRSPLTRRELEVVRRIAAGMTNKMIAEELGVSERTVDRHVSNILGKINVPSRAAAAAYAYKNELLR